MKYKCFSCSYSSDKRLNVVRHLEKKKKCPGATEDNIVELPDEVFKCIYCKKDYASNKNLLVHEKSCKASIEDLKQVIKDLTNGSCNNRGIIANVVNNNSNNVNVTNNTSVNNTFVINDYKKSKYDHISKNDILEYMRGPFTVIPNIVKRIHFDPNRPENHNAYISNARTKQGHVKQQGSWVSVDGKELARDMMSDYHYKFLHCYSEDEKLCQQYPDFERLYANYERHTNNKDEDVCKKIMDVLYDNREVCLNTKKLMNK